MKGKGQHNLGNPSPESTSGEFYAGGKSKVASETMDKTEGFKKGGKTVKMSGNKAKASAARMPRKAGGKVMSSASGGTPRSKSSHY